MSNGRRIALRGLGLLMIAVGVGFWVALIALGIDEFGETFGGRCEDDVAALGPGADECTSIWDIAEYAGASLALIAGGLVLVLMLRRPPETAAPLR